MHPHRNDIQADAFSVQQVRNAKSDPVQLLVPLKRVGLRDVAELLIRISISREFGTDTLGWITIPGLFCKREGQNRGSFIF